MFRFDSWSDFCLLRTRFSFFRGHLTRPEVDDDVDEEDGVGEAVEGDPARAQVVVEEGDGHRQDDQVRHQQQQHAQVPVKPATKNFMSGVMCFLISVFWLTILNISI